MNRILHFYLRQEVFRNLAAKNMTGSVGQKRVPKYLENSLFPLPPLPEQQRIVNKLESMLPKLKKVKELIQEIKDNLRNTKSFNFTSGIYWKTHWEVEE